MIWDEGNECILLAIFQTTYGFLIKVQEITTNQLEPNNMTSDSDEGAARIQIAFLAWPELKTNGVARVLMAFTTGEKVGVTFPSRWVA